MHPRPMTPVLALLALLLSALLLPSASTSASASVRLPDPAQDWDYQIGGARGPGPTVGTVVRDRSEQPATGRYNVCYVNAFQTQSDERARWRRADRWDLVLSTGAGPVVDGAWGEWLLDTRTAEKRHRLAGIIGGWLAGCAQDGFDAVEPDNLDSWSRSGGLLSPRDNLALARLITHRAHRLGLAVAQKNWAECRRCAAEVGFDFAVAEECARYDECGRYAAAYDDRVLVVEYRRADFERACAEWGARLPVVLRDRDVTPGGADKHC
ncbi:MAG: endo alpha-1,4 polygalactosaminidase [Nocardioides sp.]